MATSQIEQTSDPSACAQDHDAANSALGFRFVRALAVEKAALDRELPKSCVHVLAAISYHMNARIKRAWPSYERIADLTGYSEDTIDRSIRALKNRGYLFTQRRAPITGGRALVHYGLKQVRLDDYQQVITAAVMEIRHKGASDPGMKSGVNTYHPAGKPGVSAPHPAVESGVDYLLTPPPVAESAPDPAKFSASDPAKFPPQKPLYEEPKQAGLPINAGSVFLASQIADWKTLWGSAQTSSVEELLSDELSAAWPLCGGDFGVLHSAALATLAEAKRKRPKSPQGFLRAVVRTQIDKVLAAKRSASPPKRRLSRWVG